MEKEKSDREKIFGDRKRTNILKALEQPAIQFLLKIVPKFVTPNLMTAVGMFGSVVVLAAFILAKKQEPLFLLLGILGLFINWIGDSLDGRLAYYRNIARKWYGFALDIIMDWLSIILIGLGYYFYASEPYKILAFLFVVFYGWSIIIALLRYKITGSYQIDSGLVGPTELRVIIALILILEIIFNGSINYSAIAITITLLLVNVVDTWKLLETGNKRDNEERKKD
ncbi:CDP-alcohol phosphatidyltransferase family protein [Pedobacter sp.]|uniref:CDP-alcohol phosphatidyltransferase family protein n=1 Tax=Pedobacter sp. TaxID=1411316 RepID=UPI003BA9D6E0